MSTYYSASDASFNIAVEQIEQNNECYESITNTLFSNPQYYTIDSCNNLLLTPEGNKIFEQLIEQKPECEIILEQQPPTSNINDMVQEYREMVRRRQRIDQDMNMILNMDSRSNFIPTLYQQSNQNTSVSIMFLVLGISMVYYTIRHLSE
jgi:hypothetical protein